MIQYNTEKYDANSNLQQCKTHLFFRNLRIDNPHRDTTAKR